MKQRWKQILVQVLWLLGGIGIIVLLGAAMQKKGKKVCTDIRVEIAGEAEHMFIDEKDILAVINSMGKVKGVVIQGLNLSVMEAEVERNLWVKNAEMYFDNQQILQVHTEERQPIARIFTVQGSSFYLDRDGLRLPLSDKLSARVPMFTSFPSDQPILAKPDSMLLQSVVTLSQFILTDPVVLAQIAQIDITPQATFELIPVVGEQTILLGKATDLEDKFMRLKTFYKQVLLQKGIHYYESLDLQYNRQVVATRRGAKKALIDSIKTAALVNGLLNQSAHMADMANQPQPIVVSKTADSTSVPKKEPTPVLEKPTTKTVINTNNKIISKPLSKGSKPSAKKEIEKKPSEKKLTPKAVMKKQGEND